MIDADQLPNMGVLRLTTFLDKLGKRSAKEKLLAQWKIIDECTTSIGINIDERQIGLVRRVFLAKTHARGTMTRFFYNKSPDISLKSLLSCISSQLEGESKIEATFWTTPSGWVENNEVHLFTYGIIFDGYSDYYQNETRRYMREHFPKVAERNGIIIEPMQFVLLHDQDRLDSLPSERARGAEYVYLLKTSSENAGNRLAELAEERKRSIWASQTFWVGDFVGEYENG